MHDMSDTDGLSRLVNVGHESLIDAQHWATVDQHNAAYECVTHAGCCQSEHEHSTVGTLKYIHKYIHINHTHRRTYKSLNYIKHGY